MAVKGDGCDDIAPEYRTLGQHIAVFIQVQPLTFGSHPDAEGAGGERGWVASSGCGRQQDQARLGRTNGSLERCSEGASPELGESRVVGDSTRSAPWAMAFEAKPLVVA
jgi:hypothetical protein